MQSDEGRGFQGFRAIVAEQAFAEDPEDNLRTTTRYHDAHPLTGRVRSVQEHLASDPPHATPLRESRMQWAARCTDGVCFPHLVEQIERTRDLATREVLGITRARTIYEARDVRYGNPTRIEVTTGDAFATRVQRTDFEGMGGTESETNYVW